MNSLLKTLAIISAAAFPAAFLAQSFGVSLPTAIDASHTFGAFVVSLTFLTMLTDYRETKSLSDSAVKAKTPVDRCQTALPLAA